MIDPTIFRQYDIRGTYGKNLTNEIAYQIGYFLAKTSITRHNQDVVVGFDGRHSSPIIVENLSKGILAAGGRIINIGLVPTPITYYMDYHHKPAISIMVTGSHNPKDDNGFKISRSSKPFFGEEIQKLKHLITTNSQEKSSSEISIKYKDIQDDYLKRILQNITIDHKLKIVWDPGNGASGNTIKKLASLLPNHNIIINGEIDGDFPNHHPDPTQPKNLTQIIEEVVSKNYDLGVAFDGDGDRLGIVTSTGKILWGDQLLCIFARDILKNFPKATIIGDVKCSQTLFDYINNIGGNSLMCKTGHSFIKNKMQETSALLAGEMSGHIFFADKYYGYDDAIYATLRLIDIISRSSESIEDMVNALPETFNTPEIRIPIQEENKEKIIITIKKYTAQMDANYLDGIRVKNKNGWWLIRSSNTESSLIIRAEGISLQALEKQKEELKNILSKVSISTTNLFIG